MKATAIDAIDGKDQYDEERQYKVWIANAYAGTVVAADEHDARVQAARLYMATLSDVSVLPPF